MDNRNTDIAMTTRRDSKKPCCAPLSESHGCIAWSQTVIPSVKVFMTIGIDVDQTRNYSEKGLRSSSFSEMVAIQNGRRASSCLSSILLQMMEQRLNNGSKVCQSTYPDIDISREPSCNVHQGCLLRTPMINIAIRKENIVIDVSIDKRIN
jgi:hypothetical protein